MGPFKDGRWAMAAAIIFATVTAAWMFRYESYGDRYHRNRITGAICDIIEDCWSWPREQYSN
jgi:hypothetical protein